jgi:pimeloyl-ACP methyl ester carboxylesterase
MQRYAIQVSDYGAPVGWRLAVAHPERITAIVTHNSNTYEEGLSEGWNPIEKYWKEQSEVNRKAPCEFLGPESIKWQYTHGVADPERVASKAYTLDSALISRPGNDEIQLDLFLDYASNVARYPEFQAAGAEAFNVICDNQGYASQAWNTQKYFSQRSAVRNGNFYGSRIDRTPSTGN